MNLDDAEIKSLLRASNGLIKWNNDRLKFLTDELNLVNAKFIKLTKDINDLESANQILNQYFELLKYPLREIQSKETKERLKK